MNLHFLRSRTNTEIKEKEERLTSLKETLAHVNKENWETFRNWFLQQYTYHVGASSKKLKK